MNLSKQRQPKNNYYFHFYLTGTDIKNINVIILNIMILGLYK